MDLLRRAAALAAPLPLWRGAAVSAEPLAVIVVVVFFLLRCARRCAVVAVLALCGARRGILESSNLLLLGELQSCRLLLLRKPQRRLLLGKLHGCRLLRGQLQRRLLLLG